MDGIDSNRLLLQMRLMAARAENKATFEAPNISSEDGVSFGNLLTESLSKVNELQLSSDNKVGAYLKGENVDLPDVMISLQSSSLALKAASEVRNKFVTAYNDIMNMSM